MPTTTNYGWTTPADTDLVKDGAAAIRTLGSSVDTTVKNLNPETTLGDISYRSSTANTNTRLAIGSSGQILTVSGGVPTWTTPASSGGMTLITTTTFDNTASTYTYSSLGSYKHLMIVGDNISMAQTTSVTSLVMQFNSVSTGTPYTSLGYGNDNSSFSAQSYHSGNYLTLGTRVVVNGNQSGLACGVFYCWIYDYAGSTRKQIAGSSYSITTSNAYQFVNQGFWNSTNAITSLTIFSENASNLKTGTLKLYGVS